MINGTIHNMQGQPLPTGWRADAPARAKAAEAAYLERLQNAWQAPKPASADLPAVRSCRLVQQ